MAYQAWSVVFGEQPSAAKWNILGTNDAAFRDGTGITALTIGSTTPIRNSYKFSAYQSTTQNVPQNTATKVQLQTESYDTGSNFDSSTNYRFTAPISGFYHFSGAVQTLQVTGTVMITYLYKNGSVAKTGNLTTNNSGNNLTMASNVSGDLQLIAGDYIELYIFESQSGSAGTITGVSSTSLDGFLISNT